MRDLMNANITDNTTLAEAVTESVSLAEVFDKYEIDYGNYGHQTIREACVLNDVNVNSLLKKLREHQSSDSVCRFIGEWDPSFLCDFISANLHTRLKKLLSNLQSSFKYAEKKKLVPRDPARLFSLLAEDLQSHIKKEQRMLFPYIKRLTAEVHSGNGSEIAPFGKISGPLSSLTAEHISLAGSVSDLRRLLSQSGNKRRAESEVTLLEDLLREFAGALTLYIHFENNLLFPKARTLEKKVFKQNKKTINTKSKTA
jgi:regulator of cell morphogenesis and NO signaling